jgi:hypothetical protein
VRPARDRWCDRKQLYPQFSISWCVLYIHTMRSAPGGLVAIDATSQISITGQVLRMKLWGVCADWHVCSVHDLMVPKLLVIRTRTSCSDPYFRISFCVPSPPYAVILVIYPYMTINERARFPQWTRVLLGRSITLSQLVSYSNESQMIRRSLANRPLE